jgi:hypothetical protein
VRIIVIFACLSCIRTETDHLLFGNVDISVRTITVTDTDMWDIVTRLKSWIWNVKEDHYALTHL